MRGSRFYISMVAILFLTGDVHAQQLTDYVTTTMDGLFDWYAQGFNSDAPTTGLPPAGIVKSLIDPSSTLLLQPYDQKNVLLLGNGEPVSGTLTLATPTPAKSLALFVATGNGPAGLTATVHFSDGTPNVTQTLTALDWFNNTSVALSAHGRIQVVTGTEFVTGTVAGAFNVVGGDFPVIDQDDFSLSLSTAHPVSSVDLTFIQQYYNVLYPSRTAIFGLSASLTGASPYVAAPLTASSFNEDVVVDADAVPEPGISVIVVLFLPVCVLRRRRTVAHASV